jgi:hypothetical protein
MDMSHNKKNNPGPSATPTIIIPVDKYFFVRDGEKTALYEKRDDGQPGNLICEIPPAPLPAEVEEAMDRFTQAIKRAYQWRNANCGLKTACNENDFDEADQVRTMEVKPIRATRAFVETHAMAVYRAYDQHDAKALMGHALRELGIVVEVKL